MIIFQGDWLIRCGFRKVNSTENKSCVGMWLSSREKKSICSCNCIFCAYECSQSQNMSTTRNSLSLVGINNQIKKSLDNLQSAVTFADMILLNALHRLTSALMSCIYWLEISISLEWWWTRFVIPDDLYFTKSVNENKKTKFLSLTKKRKKNLNRFSRRYQKVSWFIAHILATFTNQFFIDISEFSSHSDTSII